ncbi:gluconokinase [Fervidobacterium sp.]
MKRYYIGLDVGTSSTKVIIFDAQSLEIKYKIAQNYDFTLNKRFGITVDPQDVEKAVKHCLISAAEKLKSYSSERNEVYIVLDTMLHSLLFLSKEMRPIGNVIPWTNELGTDVAISIMKDELLAKELHSRTGCPVASTYPLYKLIWFSKNEPEILKNVGKIASIKDYLIYILTDSFVVDKSIASGSGYFDIRADKWAHDLLSELARLDSSLFPEAVSGKTVLKPSKLVKNIFDEAIFDVRIVVGTSDGAASSMGTTFADSGLITISLGTSAAIRRVSNRIPDSAKMTGFGTWCYIFDDSNYIVGSATNNCGNVINWWKNNSLKSEDYGIYEKILRDILTEKDSATFISHRVLFKPTVFGMRSIRWLPYQRAEFYNVSPHSTLDDMTRAVLEGLTFKFKRAVNAVEEITEELVGRAEGFVASGGLLEISGFGTLLSTILNRNVFYRSSRYDAVFGTVLFALKSLDEEQFWKFLKTNQNTKVLSVSSTHVNFYEKLYDLWLKKIQENETQVINKLLSNENN